MTRLLPLLIVLGFGLGSVAVVGHVLGDILAAMP